MKRTALLICLVLLPLLAKAQGYPIIRNFTAKEYGAHNRNFDVEIGKDGTVYVANFEGLLYYDRSRWRIIHTPDVNRLTVVYREKKTDIIWVGGYNFFARIEHKSNGEPYFERIARQDLFRGEVMEIYEDNGSLQFLASDGNIYEVKGDQALLKRRTNTTFVSNLQSSVIEVGALKEGKDTYVLTDVTQTESLSDGLQAIVKNEKGLIIADHLNRPLYTLREENGLCSDNVAYIAYDGHGVLWGATDHGIFAVEIPSVYSVFLSKEGLVGEVHTIAEFNGKMFVGTNNGLFQINGNSLSLFGDIRHCCWKLLVSPYGLLAATSSGTYLITANGAVRQLTSNLTVDVLLDGQQIYTGEIDGVYTIQTDGGRHKISDIEGVIKILKDDQGCFWVQNVYGKVYSKPQNETTFKHVTDNDGDVAAAIVKVGNKVEVVKATSTKPFPYPTFSATDDSGNTWLTNNEGKQFGLWNGGKPQEELEHLLYPLKDMIVSAFYRQGNKLWIGGDEILTIVDLDRKHLSQLTVNPKLLFRSVVISGDSVLWGGYGDMPKELPQLPSDKRTLQFYYALDYAPLSGQVLYRYRLNGEQWSAWSTAQEVEFINLNPGSYKLEVQAHLSNGELSDIETIGFSIAAPFYVSWYMQVVYAILIALLVYLFVRYRMRRLKQNNLKLERIVRERTSEVVKQKDEIEEKSKTLEKALNDLGKAQNQLIRQEKMATIGKLTQGLIDRILNPLNYINNFSKLSEGLVKDIKANIEDDKDAMATDNYEDTMDVLDMLTANLQKVGEHGQNTTRTLKAMEEILRDRSGGYADIDLVPILKNDEELLKNYYAKELKDNHIQVRFVLPESKLMVHGNGELLSKTMMSILANAVYAITRKVQHQVAFAPEISVTATTDGQHHVLRIRDNGIGIEETIINKVFDPFFTTKPTGEAAGTGLYLSHETIQNHGGTITVESIKNEYCEFIITLPALTEKAYGTD